MKRLVGVVGAVAALGCAGAVAPSAEGAGVSATRFGGTPLVGAVFANTTGSGSHYCSGAVVSSTSRDTIVTAAHCVRGSGVGLSFVPGYVSGTKPYGVWTVSRVYADPRWVSSQNPLYDVAVVKLAKRVVNGKTVGIQDVTGGYVLGSAPVAKSTVTVPGYVYGTNDQPLQCTASVFYSGSYPGFTCGGYGDGVSGSPFVATVKGVSYVEGVIGGLHQGGCTVSTSYSSPFGASQASLVARAQSGAAGDVLPVPGSDGC